MSKNSEKSSKQLIDSIVLNRIASVDEFESAWEEALDIWGFNIWLSMPEFIAEDVVKEKTSMNDLIAFTDLTTRQVTINTTAIEKFNLKGSICEIMAHEIGHHFKYPATMQEAAALQVIQEKLLPNIKAPMFINLFEDLLINRNIGDDYGKEKDRRDKLAKIYENCLVQNAQAGEAGLIGYVFLFYLAIYEKLWNCKIITHALRDRLRKFCGTYGVEAEVLIKELWKKPSTYHKFVYFCSVFKKYIEQDASDAAAKGFSIVAYIPAGSCAKEYNPDVDDVNSVLNGTIAEVIDEAIEDILSEKDAIADAIAKAQKSGKKKAPAPGKDQEKLDIINRLTKHRPGHDAKDFQRVLVSKNYQRLVDANILKIPASIKAMEKTIPSVLEDWEWGESIKAIDWTGTILTQGPLAGIRPQQRDLIVDDGAPEYYDVPAIEIYLDTSGSMPNPQQSVNAMSLAAMILAASSIRHKGIVRAIIYSSGPYKESPWMRDELESNNFLLHYVGGGTDYPFDHLEKSCADNKNVVRVIISDSDFLYNLQGDVYGYGGKKYNKSVRDILRKSIKESKRLVAMLHLDKKQGMDFFKDEITMPNFQLVTVQDLSAYAKAAAELAAALFDGYQKP